MAYKKIAPPNVAKESNEKDTISEHESEDRSIIDSSEIRNDNPLGTGKGRDKAEREGE